jgi:hypothetical protein
MSTKPACLYRAFTEREHAVQFSNGIIRLGLLSSYKETEDAQRQDESEGESSTYLKRDLPVVTISKHTMEIIATGSSPGLLHFRGTNINPKYLLCTSGPGVDLNLLRNKFGNHVVKINSPIRLLNDINRVSPISSKMEFIGKCTLDEVCYSKDQIQDLDPDSTEAVRLSYLQKHPKFSVECEYRYIVMAKPCVKGEKPENHVLFNINRKLDYLELI